MENEKRPMEDLCDNDDSEKDILTKQDTQSESNCADKPQTEDNLQEDTTAKKIDEMRAKLEEKSRQCEEYYGKLQRIAAEFDNYKKRTAKEKEGLYTEAVSDVISTFLPAVDNLERAIQASCSNGEGQSLKEGIELVSRQIQEVLKNLGVESIQSKGQNFDPQLHNAVMHVEDEAYGESIVVEEFQKGYLYKEKVIRHSMVKVAN